VKKQNLNKKTKQELIDMYRARCRQNEEIKSKFARIINKKDKLISELKSNLVKSSVLISQQTKTIQEIARKLKTLAEKTKGTKNEKTK
jgi:predicted transcriptional regulator YheO